MRLPYLHTCANCGVRIRRHRQSTNAAWYKRHNLEPKPFPITWVDPQGWIQCNTTTAVFKRWRYDHNHWASPDEFSVEGSDE